MLLVLSSSGSPALQQRQRQRAAQQRQQQPPRQRHRQQQSSSRWPAPAAGRPRSVAAAAAATAAPAALLDLTVVSAASAASFKLLFLCAVVAWMSHRHMIPANTSQVMSQVAFSVTIPAMLLATTAKTLATSQASNLLAIPAIAVAQIALGAAFGHLACAAVAGRFWPTRLLLGWRELHPTPSAAAIAASAAAALRAPAAAPALLPPSSGVPQALPQLIQLACSFGNTVTLPLLYLSAMLPAAEAGRAVGYMSLFHAAWSPCLWLFGYGLLRSASGQPARARRRPGIGAQLAGFWKQLVAAARGTHGSGGGPAGMPSGSSSSSGGGFAPPSSQPAVLITKQLPPSAGGAAGGAGGRAVFAVQSSEDEEDQETPAEALLKRALRVVRVLLGVRPLVQLRAAINPPVAAVLAGVLLGVSPAGRILVDKAAAAAFVSQHSSNAAATWELTLLLGVLHCCWETVELMASGTLALQALVLAASLFSAQPPAAAGGGAAAASEPDAEAEAQAQAEGDAGLAGAAAAGGAPFTGGGSSGSGPAARRGTVEVESPGGASSLPELEGALRLTGNSGAAALSRSGSSSSSSLGHFSGSLSAAGGRGVVNVTRLSAATADDAGASVLRQLRPQGWEWRTLLSVAAVRFVLLPACSCCLVLAALRAGLLPADPACAFMLLLQSAMPPAQNLVLMVQLQPGTAALAPATARLLLQLYTVAVLPVTLLVSVFAKLVL